MHDYSAEMLQQMRKMGHSKPDVVSDDEWAGTEEKARQTHLYETIAEQMLMGLPKAVIMQSVNSNLDQYAKIVSSTEFKDVYRSSKARLSGVVKEAVDKNHLLRLFNEAVATLQMLMENPSTRDNVRLDAAKYVIDHSIGKANQPIDVNTTSLMDFIKEIELLREQQLATLETTARPILDKSIMVIDAVIDSANSKDAYSEENQSE